MHRAAVAWLASMLSFGIASCDRASIPATSPSAVLGQTITEGGQTYRVVTVPTSAAAQLRLIWRDGDDKLIGDLAGLEKRIVDHGERFVFATNSGIFDPTRTPVGLHIENGKPLVELNRGDGTGNFYLKPNGVFFEADGRLQICETGEFTIPPERVRFATQSGPLLLRGGRENTGFDPASANRKRRSAVGVTGAGDAVFVLSEGRVTFHELASLFRDRCGCADALYLDGEISKFYAPRFGWNDGDGQFAGIIALIEPNAGAR